jgi:hypothetical protein
LCRQGVYIIRESNTIYTPLGAGSSHFCASKLITSKLTRSFNHKQTDAFIQPQLSILIRALMHVSDMHVPLSVAYAAALGKAACMHACTQTPPSSSECCFSTAMDSCFQGLVVPHLCSEVRRDNLQLGRAGATATPDDAWQKRKPSLRPSVRRTESGLLQGEVCQHHHHQ